MATTLRAEDLAWTGVDRRGPWGAVAAWIAPPERRIQVKRSAGRLDVAQAARHYFQRQNAHSCIKSIAIEKAAADAEVAGVLCAAAPPQPGRSGARCSILGP